MLNVAGPGGAGWCDLHLPGRKGEDAGQLLPSPSIWKAEEGCSCSVPGASSPRWESSPTSVRAREAQSTHKSGTPAAAASKAATGAALISSACLA